MKLEDLPFSVTENEEEKQVYIEYHKTENSKERFSCFAKDYFSAIQEFRKALSRWNISHRDIDIDNIYAYKL